MAVRWLGRPSLPRQRDQPLHADRVVHDGLDFASVAHDCRARTGTRSYALTPSSMWVAIMPRAALTGGRVAIDEGGDVVRRHCSAARYVKVVERLAVPLTLREDGGP